MPLGSLFAPAGPGGAEVDEVAADRGVVPHPCLVLRAVVENSRADGIPARLEARPPFMLLGDQDVAYQRAGDLPPAGAVSGESELPVFEGHLPAELVEVMRQVGLVRRLRDISAGFELPLQGFAQLAQRRQVVGGQPGRA